MKTLIVGDNTVGFANWAVNQYSPCSLLTVNNLADMSNGGNFYTSLADLSSFEQLLETLRQADQIVYYPELEYTNTDLKRDTDHIFCFYILENTNNKNKIKNFKLKKDPMNVLGLVDQRKTDDPQIWAAGCSLSSGVGLININDRYGQQIADHFNKQITFLSQILVSMPWSADQILRSDIRQGDLIIWHISEIHRYVTYRDNHPVPMTMAVLQSVPGAISTINFTKTKLTNINEHHFKELTDTLNYLKSLDKKSLNELRDDILDDTRFLEAIQSMYQVLNFCNKLGVNIILVDSHHILRIDDMLTRNLVKYLANTTGIFTLPTPIDLGIDEYHPGPATHTLWANILINYINEKGWII